ncbi:mercuric transporter MerT family protein [Rhizobium mesoamericanum]|uniref:mercuric transporter MerT family protein n=1 Tax=Rhizobium mesoamericanum TaxID=1079800 RepID=UPI0004169B01|nr:mercuric transporter MerT family protein [Rhizobium mesoamericanum]
MAVPSSNSPAQKRPFPGAELLTFSGLAAAFGLAACCALPLLLATLGLSTAWLTGVALIATPHRSLLMAIGAACLLGGAVLLWRQQRAAAVCEPGQVCSPRWVRALTLVGLLAGAGLLWAGYAYA